MTAISKNILNPISLLSPDLATMGALMGMLREPLPSGASLAVNKIKRVIPGTYSVVVEGEDGRDDRRCICLCGASAALFGAKEFLLPQEGAQMVTVTFGQDTRKCYGLMVLPEELVGVSSEAGAAETVAQHGPLSEPGADYWSQEAYRPVAEDADTLAHAAVNSGRPFNLLPGTWGAATTLGAAISLLHFMASLKGSERAKLECFVLDDLVRLISGQWQHYTATGETHIYNDGGYPTLEMFASHFGPEVRGAMGYEKLLEDSGKYTAEQERYLRNAELDDSLRRRFQMFLGGLGSMLQVYLRNARDGQESAAAGFRCALDNSGALSVASAAGMRFELNDGLPVPRRTAMPWENPEEKDPAPRKWYQPGTSDIYRYAGNLLDLDAAPYDEAQTLLRFREDGNFEVDDYGDVTRPSADYDELGSRTVEDSAEYAARAGGRAGWSVNPDGSVRLWEACGGEIFMRGGDIVLACPGRVLLQTGKGLVALGEDMILKAHASVDITASTKDVRVSAEKNLHMYSNDGGMLFEAAASGSPNFQESASGESVYSRGIIFKARESSILLWSSKLTIVADSMIAKVEEAATLFAKTVTALATKFSVFFSDTIGWNSKSDVGMLSLSQDNVTVLGGSVNVVAENSVQIAKGRKGANLMWGDIEGKAPYEVAQESISKRKSQLMDSDLYLRPSFTSDLIENIKFTYRTPEQYGTVRGAEVYRPPAAFALTQAGWQLLAGLGSSRISGSLQSWGDDPVVNDTQPWPGKESYKTSFVAASGLSNIDPASGKYRNADGMSQSGMTLSRKSMSEYKVIV